ncbi:MAG: hypothetical protein IJU96_07935 [Clostridia bacterium]|nr:hypothetical protein [Clostridia bacterium]
MNKSKNGKKLLALLLAAAALFGFCSCGSKNEETVAAQAEVTTAYVTEPETTTAPLAEETAALPEQTTVPTEQTTAQTVRTTKAVVTQTQTKKEATTEPLEIGEIETIRDGDKTIVFPSSLRTSSKRWPVISWANGTGCPTFTYTALLKELAAGGYIVIADADVMSGDGKTQIDSLNDMLRRNGDPASPFYRKVDTAALGVCGHSQGGRSCVNAAQANERIRCVVSIAGASSVEEASGLKTPSLFIAGSCDLIVVAAQWCKPSYKAVAGAAAYASLRGAVHTTCMTQPKKVSGYALAWFDAFLKNDPAAKKVFADNGKLANDKAWRDFQCKDIDINV